MKFEFIILMVTTFIIYNTYHDGHYTKMFSFGQKYVKMVSYGFVGLSLYIFFKRKPRDKQTMVSLFNDIVRYMPLDKDTSKMYFDLSTMGMPNKREHTLNSDNLMSQQNRMMTSGAVPPNVFGNKPTKRSVSETKKKFVASRQHWKCNKCNQMLEATFEIDHIVDLQYGGSNEVSNLVALCRNCHGNKTMQKFL
jgi:5-methylcytosine-specific restriction endonuclease McrA